MLACFSFIDTLFNLHDYSKIAREATSKAEGAEMKKYKKEMQKWKLGKYTLKSIVAEIDKKVVELGSSGGRIFLYLSFFLASSFGIHSPP